jgi:hypothetical protein
MSEKITVGFLSPICGEWFSLHEDKLKMVNKIEDAKYIIYESNGDPIQVINTIKNKYPKDKLVFILSGDQNQHIDNECIWFTNAIKPSGLEKYQTQIFVTNPAMYKYYEKQNRCITQISKRHIDIYFKGTIWNGMRTTMYNFFKDKVNTIIEKNDNYWSWRLNGYNRPSQEELEQESFKMYQIMDNAKLSLCPKGNGNSSMRILESLACGSIPILINDTSQPFGYSIENFALVFDTKIHNWEYIYDKCIDLINDNERLNDMQKKGHEYFENIVYGDYKNINNKMYKDLNTVCYGFSTQIINKLIELSKNRN